MDINIIVYKQNITVTSPMFDRLIHLMMFFNSLYTTKKLVKKQRRMIYVKDKEYFAIDNRDFVIRYPVSLLDKIIKYLKEKQCNINIKYNNANYLKDNKIEINHTVKFKLKQYQVDYRKGIVESKNPTELISLKTGYGKTTVVLAIMSDFKRIFGILILPKYIDKWIDDIEFNTDIKRDEIHIFKGGDSLRDVMDNKIDLSKIKVFIFSLSTLQHYLKEWLDVDSVFTYKIKPTDLMKHLKIGYLINDETHQDFHNVYNTQLFFNTEKFIGLTATLEHGSMRMNNMYETLFPLDKRLKVYVPINKYIHVVGIKYYFNNPSKIRYRKPFGYSHQTLEQSIIRSSRTLNNYLFLIYRLALQGYVKRKVNGDKLIVFASKVHMCEEIVKYFKKQPELRKLKITKYTEEEDYKVISENDIIISTLQSASTALDIPNLITVIQTVAVDSVQSNKQSLGRLRDLKNKNMLFYYLWSGNIPQHSGYNIRRRNYFKDFSKSTRSIVFDKKV